MEHRKTEEEEDEEIFFEKGDFANAYKLYYVETAEEAKAAEERGADGV